MERSTLMESDYAYRLCAVIWARCLLEWARVCNTPAFVHAGSSPAAPIDLLRRGIKCLKAVPRAAIHLLWGLGCRLVRFVIWVLETPVFPYRQ
jgi:hypothetical protein